MTSQLRSAMEKRERRLALGKKKGVGHKPGSVVDHHSSRQHVTVLLKRPTREQCGPHLLFLYLVLLQVGFTMPLNVATSAVRSYRTLSPLPANPKIHVGGLLSAALSVGSRPPGVTWHLALRSPDFPRLRKRNRDGLGNSSCMVHRYPKKKVGDVSIFAIANRLGFVRRDTNP